MSHFWLFGIKVFLVPCYWLSNILSKFFWPNFWLLESVWGTATISRYSWYQFDIQRSWNESFLAFLGIKGFVRKGSLKKKKNQGIFPKGEGGPSDFGSFSLIFFLFFFIFKHALNHPEMQRNFFPTLWQGRWQGRDPCIWWQVPLKLGVGTPEFSHCPEKKRKKILCTKNTFQTPYIK